MFEIKVTVDLPGIPEAINNLAAAFAGRYASAEENATQAAAPVVVAAPAIVSDPAPVAPAPLSVQQTAPVAAPVPVVTTPAPSDPPKKKVYTFKEISEAGAALCNQGPEMTDRLVALLQTKYNVDSIVDLGEEHYAELAADLQMFGAQMG